MKELQELLALLKVSGVTEYEGPLSAELPTVPVKLRLDPAYAAPVTPALAEAKPAEDKAAKPTLDEQLFEGLA